jgi:hypothetical protein
MVRVEIIANHSVEENILEAFAREGVGKFYTKYPNVFGIGTSGPRMGDAVWPEENFALIVWCEEDEARGIARAVAAVKKQFPDEGIRIFGIPAEPSRFPHAAEPVWPSAEAHPHAEPAPQAAPAAYGASPSYTPAAPVYSPAAPQAPAVSGVYTAPPPQPAYTPPPGPAAPISQPVIPAASAAPQAAPVYAHPAPATPAYTPPPAVPAIPADTGIGKEYDGQNMEN